MTAANSRNKPEEQEYLLMDVGDLTPHPENPNEGDVEQIADGIRENGFFGAVLVQRSTNRILAGEHRWRAAIEEGATQVPVISIDVDDDRALRILVSDNAAGQLAKPDPHKLGAIIERLATTKRGLAGTLQTADAAAILAARKIPTTEKKEAQPPIDQIHFLITLPLEDLADVQTALADLPETVEIRSTAN